VRIVLDTNVLVSGLLSPHGAPGRVLDAVLAGTHVLLLDDRIRSEYAEVLGRRRFGFASDDVAVLLRGLESRGESVTAPPLSLVLPDADDLPFLEVAAAGRADRLVTGNPRHFAAAARRLRPGTVVSPAQFLGG
jgi:putative PIN family toxin of toxin-antitoxin system